MWASLKSLSKLEWSLLSLLVVVILVKMSEMDFFWPSKKKMENLVVCLLKSLLKTMDEIQSMEDKLSNDSWIGIEYPF